LSTGSEKPPREELNKLLHDRRKGKKKEVIRGRLCRLGDREGETLKNYSTTLQEETRSGR